MKRYTIYLGCMIPMRFPSIEKSARMVFERLGAEVVDLEGYTCCPDPVLTRLAEDKLSLALSARNLALAEKLGNDMLVLCNGCFETLIEAKEALDDPMARAEANAILAREGLMYGGNVRVRALIDVLGEDFSLADINGQLVCPKPVKSACHTGCHMLRSAQHPRDRIKALEEIVARIGAAPVRYGKELDCCGFPASIADEAMTMESLIAPKLRSVAAAGAEAMVTGCPTCLYQLEANQSAARKSGLEMDLPVFHVLELMALAMGARPSELGLELHRSPARAFAEKMWGDVHG